MSKKEKQPKKSGKSNSPFRYPGGKFYARKLIIDCMPSHTNYCEPFFGGGSIFFAKEKSEKNVLNDKDAELMNVYLQIRDNIDELVEMLDGIKATKELHKYYKNEYKPKTPLERAFRWYYLNRTSYSGIMKPENCYWGYGDKYSMRPENWGPHLRQVSDRLQGTTLLNQDFEDVISSLKDEHFIFLDPPYYNADQNKFYNCFFSIEDHERLAKVVKKHSKKHKFLITYDNSPEVRELYSWCRFIEEREWNYTINRTDDQKNKKQLQDGFKSDRYKGKEIFIMNYDHNKIADKARLLNLNQPTDQQPLLTI